MIKCSLKDWHHHHSKNLEGKILDVRNQLSSLDIKEEEAALQDAELREMRDLSVNLHYLA